MLFKKIIKIILLLSTLLATVVYANNEENEEINVLEIENEIMQTSSKASEIPEINSKSAIIIDRTTKTVLYGKNEYDVRKMASTTKIMTAIIVIENSNLYDTVTISKKAAGTGGSLLGIKEGDKITVYDLLYGLLLKSGNDTAVALAEHIGGSIEGFSEMMNQKSKSLNLANTHFVTPHGLDNDSHYTTAYDLALLADYALHNQIFLNIVGTKNHTVTINGIPRVISNTNELLGNLNGVYGVKTGFTNGANRCLVTACKRGDLDIICVVLGADTKKFRTQDSIKLIEYIFNTYQMYDLGTFVNEFFENWKHNNLSKFKINKSAGNFLNIELQNFNTKLYPIKKQDIKNIKSYVNCNYIFDAPVNCNTQVGTMEITINKDLVLNYQIVNTIKVEKKNCFNYILEILSNFFKYLTIKF